MRLSFSSIRSVALTIFALVWMNTAFAQSEAKAESESQQMPVVYFHTEFFPYQSGDDLAIERHLIREYVRQAMIATAQQEFGLPTRDETLGESIPTNGPVIHLAVLERLNWKAKKWHIKLFRFGEDDSRHDMSQLWNQPPVWEATYEQGSSFDLFPQFAPVIRRATKREFSDALTKAGLTRRARSAKPSRDVPDEVLQRLNRVDFVEQYRAMRSAQQAIDVGGESDAWLEVLIRAYANLSMLTQHHWTTASEAFAARSFIYADRLVAMTGKSDRSLWHRAYSRAFAGLHYQAMADIREAMNRTSEANPGATATSSSETPPWGELIRRFCRCKRDAVSLMAEREPELKSWAARLRFFLTSTYRVSEWMFEDHKQLTEICPKAYGVYANLTWPCSDLGIKRTGAFMAPAVFERGLVDSFTDYEELPASVRKILNDTNDEIGLSPLPTFPSRSARALRQAAEAEREGNASWSVLASLIEEEMFVEAANWLHVGLDATEHSQESEANALVALVRGHRYERLIESYRFNPRDANQLAEFHQLVVDLEIVDPSRRMLPMFQRLWQVPNQSGEMIGARAYGQSQRDHSVHRLLEFCFHGKPLGRGWVPKSKVLAERLAKDVKRLSPSLEMATRMLISLAENPTPQQLKEWESSIEDDAESFRMLGVYHARAARTDDAARCLTRAFELHPNTVTAQTLANFYYGNGEPDKWEKVWLQFIDKTESYGLSHASAHQELALGMASKGQWDRAKEHAVAAAESYSSWGLFLAGTVTEALAEWDEAEEYYRALSFAYPSGSGHQWFLYCCRTGHGDRSNALLQADAYFQNARLSTEHSNTLFHGVYHLVRGKKEEALRIFKDDLDDSPSYSCGFTVAQLARDLGNPDLRTDTLAKMDSYSEGLERALPAMSGSEAAEVTALVPAARALVKLMRSGDASNNRIAELETLLIRLDPINRSMLCCLVGVELDSLGKTREAELFWRRSIVMPGRDTVFPTLAGHRLAEKYGVSRPDNRPLTEKDLWPAPKKNPNAPDEPDKP